ncbi:MFS transporter [Paenibacillus sp. sgz5001063]|uniref:MFS transporter n=1 Tax=Paenibacillus sp. sgz5001063 TaxID=3242474 RepID=UPI0036D397DF
MTLFANSSKRKPGMSFVLTMVFIDMLCLGIIVPVLPILVGTQTSDPKLQAFWYGALVVSYGLMQFLVAPLLGALSDRFGRRPILLLSIFGLAISNFVIGSASSLWILLLARIVAGATAASDTASNSYAADITPPEGRAKAFGQFGIAFGMGFILGPLLGGFLANIDMHLPFYVVGGLACLNGLYGLFMLPESLPADKRSSFSLRNINPFSAPVVLMRRRDIGVLVVVWVFFQLAFAMMIETWVLYTTFRFGWSASMNGLAMCSVGLATAIVQGGLMGALVKRYGEERTVLIGLFMAVVGYTLYGLAPQGWMMFPIIFVSLIMYATGPALLAIVSKTTKPTEQGAIIGALMSVRMLMVVIGPLMAVPLLGLVAHQVGNLPRSDMRLGVVFFICAFLQIVCLLLGYLRFSRMRKKSNNSEVEQEVYV